MPTTSGATGTSMPGTSGTTGLASTGSESAASTGAATTGVEETLTFLNPTDMREGSCDPFSQDCPAGMKCTWYADDGGSSWNNTKCVPVMENPAQEGESCVAPSGGVSGIDDCDLGLMCWDVDAENNGVCVALCQGSPRAPFCAAPSTICAISGSGFGLCLAACDPLLQDCDPSDVCIGIPSGGGFLGFLCVLDASGEEGQQHEPCMFANSCDPGLICVEVTAAVECDQNAQGCCQPFCDLTDPDADAKCGGVGQVCNSVFGDDRPLPEYEHVGHCAVPE